MSEEEQQKKFGRCMNSMHLWYGNAHIHIWMMTNTPHYNKREYSKRGWCARLIALLNPTR